MSKLNQIKILPDGKYDYFSPISDFNYYVFEIPYSQEIYIKGFTKFGGPISVNIYDLNLNLVESLSEFGEGSISISNPGIYYFQLITNNIGGSFYTEYYSYDDLIDDTLMDLNLEGVLELYTAYFNRAADKDGVDYWLKTMVKNDWTLDKISQVFSEQDEYIQTYSNLSNTEIIQKVYLNILNRAVDSEGLTYWEEQLNIGNIKVAQFIQAIVNSALEKDGNGNYINLTDATILNNKIEVSEYFYKNKLNSTNFFLNTVTTDTSTVDELKSQIDQIVMGSIDIEHYSQINDSIKSFNSDYNISTLDTEYSWNKSVITYSFNESIPDEYYDYDDLNLITDFSPLTAFQRDAVREIFTQINQLFGVKFQETNNGDIRFNITDFVTDTEGDIVAFSYFPGEDLTISGDMFLNQDYFLNQDIVQGEFNWDVIVHELGHALGLKHPFETEPILDSSIDDTYHTVMSYTERYNYTPIFEVDENGNYVITREINSPELFSLFDVAALQLEYGINPTTNSEDNIYSFSYDETISTIIFDAGGIDTLDLSSNKGNTTLNLNSGSLNSIDEYSLNEVIAKYEDEIPSENYSLTLLTDTLTSWYNDDLLYTGKNNIAISYGTIIENVTTGSGDDIVIDNEVDNIINTSAGNDYIYLGKGGADYVNGGNGTDSINISYMVDEVLIKSLDEDKYLLFTDDYLATLENIELIQFSDTSNYLSIDLFV